jgi:hypothetical protein
MEDYQTREKTYDQAITAYQQRITELLAAEGGGSGEYQDQLASAAIRIAALEASLDDANAALLEQGSVPVPDQGRPLTDTERALRILELKAAALSVSNTLNKKLAGEE